MTIHFGVLIPSTNTTTETEYSRLPPGYQAHYARVRTSTPGRPFSPGREEEVTYQSELLATAKVRMVTLLQTSASLFADDYDETTMKRMQAAAGVPSITSALAVGRAVRALGARRIALVSPYSPEVNERARHYFTAKHGLDIAALYRILAGVPIPPKPLWQGAILGAVALGVLKALGSALLGGATSNPLIGAFAVVVGLLIWFNFVCQVILIGAAWVVVSATDQGVPLDPVGDRERRQAEARLRLEIEEQVRAEYEASLPRAVRWLARRRRRT